jgi:hypothetical protein
MNSERVSIFALPYHVLLLVEKSLQAVVTRRCEDKGIDPISVNVISIACIRKQAGDGFIMVYESNGALEANGFTLEGYDPEEHMEGLMENLEGLTAAIIKMHQERGDDAN